MDEEKKELDITSDPDASGTWNQTGDVQRNRKFIGVHFSCCNLYARAYRDQQTRTYLGRCPKCFSKIRFIEGKGGRSESFYRTE